MVGDNSEPNGDTVLADVELAVRSVLDSGDDSTLRVLGYGEISTVVGWPTDQPRIACKRLPPFDNRATAESYGHLFAQYLDLLASRGVTPIDSKFAIVDHQGEPVAYVTQPVLPRSALGPEVLRAAAPSPEHPLIVHIIESVLSVCDERTGLDAQVSNWAVIDDSVIYLDVTTPMLFDSENRPLLDIAVFIAAYPWALRGILGRFIAPGVVAAYADPRNVLVDFTANLIKERLDNWVDPAITAINAQVDKPIDRAEVERYYRSDARLWEVMLRLRRADRWWQRTVRRRPYPFLLPGRIER